MLDRLLLAAASCLALAIPGATAADLSRPGPCAVGQRQVSVGRTDGTSFSALAFYPSELAGRDAPVALNGRPYPIIAFGHGYLQTPKGYTSTLQHLASWGFVVLAPESGLELFPSHAAFAADLRTCLDFAAAETARPESPFDGAIAADRCGFSGHSMGGGCSVLAASQEGPRVKVVANLAAAETIPSAIQAAAQVRVPLIMLAGSQDRIAPPSWHASRIYRGGAAPKQSLLLQGGWHCGFLDHNFPVCDSGDLPRDEQLALTRYWLTAAFRLYLAEDEPVWPILWNGSAQPSPKVLRTAASGIEWTPGESTGSGLPGAVVRFPLTVTTSGNRPQSFRLFVEGQTWPTVVVPTQTELLAAGAAATVTVEVTIPAESRELTSQSTVSARSDADGHTRGVATVRTRRSLR